MFLNWIVRKGQAEAGYWHHMCIEARSLGFMIWIASQDFAVNLVVTSELHPLE